MKRNTTLLFLESPGATTIIPWVNGAPDFTGFTEPTLGVLQAAWGDFEASSEDLEVIADPEPPISPPTPKAFRAALSQTATWTAWAETLSPVSYTNLTTAAALDNWVEVQAIYDAIKATTPPPEASITAWQTLADDNYIPITF